jgi:hypothetical protein
MFVWFWVKSGAESQKCAVRATQNQKRFKKTFIFSHLIRDKNEKVQEENSCNLIESDLPDAGEKMRKFNKKFL